MFIVDALRDRLFVEKQGVCTLNLQIF
jgi:hypothetical protein